MTSAATEVERAFASRGRLAEIANELKGLDRISKKSRDPAELTACAKRVGEISAEAQRLQGHAVGEVSRLARELQGAPGFDLVRFPEWRTELLALIATREVRP
jgi:hypothetical protein